MAWSTYGVVDVRDIILPHIFLKDGRTLSDHIKPRMEELMNIDPSKLLPFAGELNPRGRAKQIGTWLKLERTHARHKQPGSRAQ